ncbi:MAG: 2-oxoacid:ferredoxin oxidoreductase subunit beta [Deltaproteobacteria bacterium]|nr:2-oxoacid:ferredoxin oxidoreductase subunit beta [Deltaproteobacteria bacterium]MBW2308891.1 2-oxoacid:ferredoxin oxidoreductase subunit beta [Deltaproteobacteria bacterium]
MTTAEGYTIGEPSWCPGCGNFGIIQALKKALEEMGKKPHEVLLIGGIGQAAKLPHYLKGNVLNGVHGRTPPNAIGAKVANQELTVIVTTGDGCTYAEGGNHFLHAIRRNVDITLIVHNNQVYGLTRGQASPTSDPGFVTRVQTHGAFSARFHALAAALSMGGTFIARSFSGDQEHLSRMIQEAVKHKGFSLLEVLQPCVSFNRVNTFAWYKKRIYDVETGGNYDPGNGAQAFEKAMEWGERIPIGVVYRAEKPTFEERIPALKKGPLVKQPAPDKSVLHLLMEEFF